MFKQNGLYLRVPFQDLDQLDSAVAAEAENTDGGGAHGYLFK
jgi:hypothetical protein